MAEHAQNQAPAVSVGFVRFAVPDLEALETFLTAFGLVASHREGDQIYFRGADDTPYLYVARQGDPGFDGFAFDLGSAEAVRAFADRWGLGVEALPGPGGGCRAVQTDPDGFRVEAVAFDTRGEPARLRPSLPHNTVDVRPRIAQERRIALRQAQVCRLGHVVLRVSKLRASEAWYKARFGLLTSDEIVREEGADAMAMFLRLNRGATHTDHHALFLIEGGPPGFHHAAFEVRDLDDLMVGHDRLREGGYRHHRGVGRHLLGGQVFDYWCDPWGHVLEHWTDGDVFDATFGPRVSSFADLIADLWRSRPDA